MRSLEGYRSYTLVTLTALVGVATALNVSLGADAADATWIIQQVVAQSRGSVAVRATRHLEAGAVSGKHHGWMDVETTLASSGAFSWSVLGEGGSERTREKVFRAVLEAEADAWRAGARDAAALTEENYQFVSDGPVDNGKLRVRLIPRRSDSKLVTGTLIVSSDGYPLLLEGKLAKSPSFWVKSVTVVKRFGRIGNVALPISIESLADVRMVGQSSFSMRYKYTSINGRNVGHTTSSTSGFGPSPEILALHAQLNVAQ
jgi:hypothetical protein